MTPRRWIRLAAAGLGFGVLVVALSGTLVHHQGLVAFRAELTKPHAPPGRAPQADDPRVQEWLSAVRATAPPDDPLPIDAVLTFPDSAANVAFNLWLEVGPGTPTDRLLTYWQAHAPAIRALAEVLRRPGLALGSLPEARDHGVSAALLPVQRVIILLEVGARLDADPTRWLDAFDGLQAALLPPSSRIDAQLAMQVSLERDQAYLTCALLGRLEAGRTASWLGEPANARACLANGLESERSLIAMPLLKELADRSLFACLRSTTPAQGSLWRRWCGWCSLPGTATAPLVALRRYASGLRAGDAGDWVWSDTPSGRRLDSDALQLGNLAVSMETFHRLTRLAVCVLAWQHLHGELPGEGTALTTIGPGIPSPGPGQMVLVYHRLGATHFRIARDPAAPLPRFIDPAYFSSPAPPAPDRLQGLHYFAVELDHPLTPRL